ncbi:ACP S-malonyltransferase [Brevibacillus laterosporus]|uniref:[acyl-carrier-protein] S-malonyltransferase n=1 Tax=Brevibacillus laterosporus TaxID=1465 RepID=A0AAP3DI03_BRELA|nr:ACP S-malonyltransferase [Brevibacillus laterosporus]MCR8981709.1 ACP S-malonyltransferase [Brevibacillus laterosporus]MCZ0808864.1 ACP S-malonyltransferase [Brevibacillus laterosporus]MCZ0825773.1 ACP S-malonyltransferase [Brevibacillus laterosporus]MCZ0851173.1 ACP S-malonyltransferase [Brevibacillus laterosporus]
MRDLAFVFSGQGSQYVNMGKALCDQYAIARRTFEEAEQIVGFNLLKLCIEGDLEELTKTVNAQPAILATSIALWRVYMQEIGVKPHFVAGHSLGEYSALVCAGAMKFSQAVRLVHKRGLFMQDITTQGTGAMASVSGIDRSEIEKVCLEYPDETNFAHLSNINSSRQIVISGHRQAIDKVAKILEGMGATVIFLRVSAPFHSPLMQSVASSLQAELQKNRYQPMRYAVVANVNGQPYTSSEQIVENLTKQVTAPVQWLATMQFFYQEGIRKVIEFGPNKVLRNLMKKEYPDVLSYAYDVAQDVDGVKEIMGFPKDHQPFVPSVITKCLAIAVATPNRNLNADEYQKGMIEPYRRIQKMQYELEEAGAEPTIKQMREALDMLTSVFLTKKTSTDEQKKRFDEILEETGTGYLLPDLQDYRFEN